MKIKESKKMSHKDVLQFFNTLTLLGTSMRGPKEESDVALTAFYSLIISRRSVVAYITRALAPIGLEKFMPTHELIAYIQKTVDERLMQRLATYSCQKTEYDDTKVCVERRSELTLDEDRYTDKRNESLTMLFSKRAKYNFCYNVICTQLNKIAQAMAMTIDYATILHESEQRLLTAMGKENEPLFSVKD